MNEERRRILDLLAQGKISVSEAEQLLEAVHAGEPPSTEAASATKTADPRFCRVTVLAPGKDGAMAEKVNVRVPFTLVRSGIRLGALMPGFVGEKAKAHFQQQGIDIDVLKLLDQPEIETILRDLGEVTVDVNDGKSQVRVRCE
jgi:hypothetical protein